MEVVRRPSEEGKEAVIKMYNNFCEKNYFLVSEMISVTSETVVVTDESAVDQIPVAAVAVATRLAEAGT